MTQSTKRQNKLSWLFPYTNAKTQILNIDTFIYIFSLNLCLIHAFHLKYKSWMLFCLLLAEKKSTPLHNGNTLLGHQILFRNLILYQCKKLNVWQKGITCSFQATSEIKWWYQLVCYVKAFAWFYLMINKETGLNLKASYILLHIFVHIYTHTVIHGCFIFLLSLQTEPNIAVCW